MPNDADQEKRERVVQTPEQILKQAVLDTTKLDEESQEALRRKDGQEARNKLMQRARVISDLPEKVFQAGTLTGHRIPEDEMETLRSLQYIAQKALDRANAYELGLILTDTLGGSKIDKPNLLEQLVNSLYPQKPK